MSRRRLVRVEDLLGRPVAGHDGRSVGRIEEIRVEQAGDDLEVTEFLIGPGALVERLGFMRRLFGRTAPYMRIARWDQVDISTPHNPRLLCDAEALRVERPR